MPEVSINTAPPVTATPTLSPREQQALKTFEDSQAREGIAVAAQAAALKAQEALDTPPKVPPTPQQEADAKAAAATDGTIKSEEQKILGKFKTHADLEKAYTELEAKLSTKPADKAGESKAPLVSNEEMAQFAEAVTSSGDLTAEHYTALAARGLSPEIVKGYVEGLKARAEAHLKQTYAVAGGEDGYKAMAEWAGKNVPQAELEVYNSDVKSGDKARVAMAVTGLYSRYLANGRTAATQAVATRTQSSVSQSGGGLQPISGSDELIALMASPQYKNDAAFRAQIAQRMAVSSL